MAAAITVFGCVTTIGLTAFTKTYATAIRQLKPAAENNDAGSEYSIERFNAFARPIYLNTRADAMTPLHNRVLSSVRCHRVEDNGIVNEEYIDVFLHGELIHDNKLQPLVAHTLEVPE